jgi:hypothetical protein
LADGDKRAPIRGGDGYYVLADGTKLLSVTNIKKGGIPLDLSGWAGYQTGLLAMELIPKLTRVRGEQARREMATWLGQVNERIMSEAGALGGHVHNAIEAHILGLPIPALTEKEQPFFEAYLNFVEIERPVYVAAELKVANLVDSWAGQVDCYARLPRRKEGIYLLDWKTSGKAHAEFALQLAAYQRATIAWAKDGTEVAPPVVAHAAVVHIRPDKYPDCGYRIVPMDTGDEVYGCFLCARRIAIEWDRGLSKSARRRALKVLEREAVVDGGGGVVGVGFGAGADPAAEDR